MYGMYGMYAPGKDPTSPPRIFRFDSKSRRESWGPSNARISKVFLAFFLTRVWFFCFFFLFFSQFLLGVGRGWGSACLGGTRV